MTQRSYKPEWIDLGSDYYTAEEYRNCLYQLDRIGRFLGGDQATLKTLDQLSISPHSILDVGCGGGLFTMRLAEHYPQAQVTGIDLSQDAIQFAIEHLKNHQPALSNVHFYVPKTPELDLHLSVDVITATLVCHHLNDQTLIDFIKRASQLAKQAVIINDLHRHFLASAGFALIVPLIFRNRLIWHDGLLSIRRAFTRQDWIYYLQAADIRPQDYTITWHWAFRWVVTIHTATSKAETYHENS